MTSICVLTTLKIIYAIDALSSFVAGNIFVGFSLDFRIAETLKIPFAVNVDDVNVNDLVRFRFNTKIKMGLQTGLTWSPRNDILKRLRLDYQLVLPYTYSHSATGASLYSTDYNTSNNTVRGQHLATSLPPSSHRITLEVVTTPVRPLELGFAMRFIQHNNPSAGILKGPKNDGSIIDDGYYSKVYDNKEGPSFQNRNGFLRGTIEHTIESALSIGTNIPISTHASLFGDFSYTYRYIINYGLTPGLNNSEHAMFFSFGVNIASY